MKTLFTTLAAATMAMAIAGSAYAKDCNAVAQAAVDAQTHPVGSMALGCAVGAGLGSLFSNGQAGAIAGGCVAGGAGGAILSAEKRTQIYNAAYAQCAGSGPAPTPVAYSTFPPPSTSANTPYATQVNVRIGPGKDYPVQEQLPANTTVSVAVCASTGWCQVGGYKGPGWVSQSLLTFN
ncbi:MAG: SH3 domain-containing protein [Bauldia sp.]